MKYLIFLFLFLFNSAVYAMQSDELMVQEYEQYKIANQICNTYQEIIQKFIPDCTVGYLILTDINQTTQGFLLLVSASNAPVSLGTPWGEFIFTYSELPHGEKFSAAMQEFIKKFRVQGYENRVYRLLRFNEIELKYPHLRANKTSSEQIKLRLNALMTKYCQDIQSLINSRNNL